MRTRHALGLYAFYLAEIDTASGRDPYLNDEIMRLFEELSRPAGTVKMDALFWLAKAHRARDRRDLAEKYMREAMEERMVWMRTTSDPHWGPMVVNDALTLESWLVEWGEEERARKVAEWRKEMLSSYQASDTRQLLT